MAEKRENTRMELLLRIGFCVAVVTLMVLVGAVMASAEVYSGECGARGDNITWTLDTETGVLEFFGEGAMANYTYRSNNFYASSTAPYNGHGPVYEVIFHEGITNIGTKAFWRYGSLKKVSIPASVSSVSTDSFAFCTALEEYVVDENNPIYYAESGCLINRETKTIVQGTVTSVIPEDENVQIIGTHAFFGRSPQALSIPSNIKTIGSMAFRYCYNLKSVELHEGLEGIGGYAFSNSGLQRIVIPNTVTYLGGSCFYECYSLVSVVLSQNITSLWGYTFGYCKILSEIVIPEGFTSFGGSDFISCSKLNEVILPSTLTKLADRTFWSCGIEEIVIPDGITAIREYTFIGCGKLTAVTIPNSVTLIEFNAFHSCKHISDVYFKGTKAEWDQIVIRSGNEDLLNATIHFLGEVTQITAASLTAGRSLTMNYYATLALEHLNAQMRFTYRDEVTLVDGVYNTATGEFVFSFDRIPPQCMAENIKAELVLVDEDGTVTVLDEKAAYSIRQYCDDALAAYPDDEKLTTLLADLLAYGAASQQYTNYQKDEPVNEGFSVGASDLLTVTDTDLILSASTSEAVKFTAVGVRFGYINRIYYKLTAADVTDVTITVGDTVYTVADLVPVEGAEDTYILYGEPIYATEFDKVFTAALAVNGESVQTLAYSVKSYIYSMQNGQNETMTALARALYTYGKSAENYKNQ